MFTEDIVPLHHSNLSIYRIVFWGNHLGTTDSSLRITSFIRTTSPETAELWLKEKYRVKEIVKITDVSSELFLEE